MFLSFKCAVGGMFWSVAGESHQVESQHLRLHQLQIPGHGLPLLSALLLQFTRHHVGGEVIRTLFSSAHKKYLHPQHSKETNTCQCCGSSFFLTDNFSLFMLQKPEKMGLNIALG